MGLGEVVGEELVGWCVSQSRCALYLQQFCQHKG